jgi:hypothetical protein
VEKRIQIHETADDVFLAYGRRPRETALLVCAGFLLFIA